MSLFAKKKWSIPLSYFSQDTQSLDLHVCQTVANVVIVQPGQITQTNTAILLSPIGYGTKMTHFTFKV